MARNSKHSLLWCFLHYLFILFVLEIFRFNWTPICWCFCFFVLCYWAFKSLCLPFFIFSPNGSTSKTMKNALKKSISWAFRNVLFYQIIRFDWVMNLFPFCVKFLVKKESFLAKTAVSRRPYGFTIVCPFVIYHFFT